MAVFDVPVTKKDFTAARDDLPFEGFMGASIHKGSLSHTHNLFPADNAPSLSFRVDLQEMPQLCKPHLEHTKAGLLLPADQYPYDLTESQWWEYALSPHSYLSLGHGQYQIGLNYFNRFLHLDVQLAKAHLFNPGIGDEFLSTTNWLDEATGQLWFASWTAQDALKRNSNPLHHVQAAIWTLSLDNGKIAQVWRGNLGDSLRPCAPGCFWIILQPTMKSSTKPGRHSLPGGTRQPMLLYRQVLVLRDTFPNQAPWPFNFAPFRESVCPSGSSRPPFKTKPQTTTNFSVAALS